jgi:hypothetical protein
MWHLNSREWKKKHLTCNNHMTESMKVKSLFRPLCTLLCSVSWLLYPLLTGITCECIAGSWYVQAMAGSVHVTQSVLAPWMPRKNFDRSKENKTLTSMNVIVLWAKPGLCREQIEIEKQKRWRCTILPRISACTMCSRGWVRVYICSCELWVALDAFTHGSACMLDLWCKFCSSVASMEVRRQFYN